MSMRWQVVEDDPQGALFADEELVERHVGCGEFRGLEFFHVRARRVLNPVPASSRMPFSTTINTYRGCSHACTYCFARPTHAYLDLGVGADFDRKIVVKVNAVERAHAELAPRVWGHAHVALGTNTDPYQRCEGKYHLTQGLLGVFARHRVPASVLTKSTLLLRDLEALRAVHASASMRANLSIACLDAEVWRAVEPGTPHPERRIEAVARLNDAGVPCGVLLAPIIPGLSDRPDRLRAAVTAAVDAGAVSIGASVLYLTAGVREHFISTLRVTHPDLAFELDERFATRTSLPATYARQIQSMVRAMAEQARTRRGHRGAGAPPVTTTVVTAGGIAERRVEMGLGPGLGTDSSLSPAHEMQQLSLIG